MSRINQRSALHTLCINSKTHVDCFDSCVTNIQYNKCVYYSYRNCFPRTFLSSSQECVSSQERTCHKQCTRTIDGAYRTTTRGFVCVGHLVTIFSKHETNTNKHGNRVLRNTCPPSSSLRNRFREEFVARYALYFLSRCTRFSGVFLHFFFFALTLKMHEFFSFEPDFLFQGCETFAFLSLPSKKGASRKRKHQARFRACREESGILGKQAKNLSWFFPGLFR